MLEYIEYTDESDRSFGLQTYITEERKPFALDILAHDPSDFKGLASFLVSAGLENAAISVAVGPDGKALNDRAKLRRMLPLYRSKKRTGTKTVERRMAATAAKKVRVA